MRLLVAVLAVSVGGIAAQQHYASAPLRPIAPYRYYYPSQERIVQQGHVSTVESYRPSYSSSSSLSSKNPCNPSPCGRNTRCDVSRNNIAQCRCITGYVPRGNTIHGCKVQCERNDDCPNEYRCSANKCVRVCVTGACAANARCESYNHAPRCTCGANAREDSDPYVNCFDDEPEVKARPPAEYVSPCEYEPCGQFANCRVDDNDRAVCSCPIGYEGDPLVKCTRGECIENNDCPSHRVCQKLRCIDPCLEGRDNGRSMCGVGADCKTENHQPICSCPRGYTGNPMIRCREFDPEELCRPSPCGPNTNCRVRGDRAVCSCYENYIGDPLESCRPECTTDSDCDYNMACKNNLCVNPCSATYSPCGENAYCNVVNRQAECTCPEYFLGNARSRCYTECTNHNDCRSNQHCNKFRCEDPCATDACGIGANCNAKNHTAICSCPKTHTGDPFEGCRLFTDDDYCNPNPCGENSNCDVGFDSDGEKRPVCTCAVGFIGNPLLACKRGDCTTNDQCADNKACHMYQCKDPCFFRQEQDDRRRGGYDDGYESVCGENAYCDVRNHVPICSCPRGYEGDPTVNCYEDRRRGNRYVAGRYN